MAIEKFRFVSPGVQINEIDDSVIPPAQPAVGPVIIGSTAKGPAMQPVVVNTVGELEKVFGGTSNGNVSAVDVWRTGAPTAPTLATYAAKAFLRNSTPVTVLRLAGIDKVSGQTGEAGWTTDRAWGLFAVSGSSTDAVLAAVIYTSASINVQVSNSVGGFTSAGSASISGDNTFKLRLSSSAAQPEYELSLATGQTGFIRNLLNTNPSRFSSTSYFLGETFEKSLPSGFDEILVARLSSSFVDYQDAAQDAVSGYVISDHGPDVMEAVELFRLKGLNAGSSTSRDIKISIENVRASKNLNVTKYGTFDVVVRKLYEPLNAQAVLERFSGVNLDVTSDNYIAKRIGDSYREWDITNQRYVEKGSYTNRSAYIRVEMANTDISPFALPHGFRTVARPTIATNSPTALSSLGLTGSHPNIPLLETEISASTAKSTRFGLVSHPTNNIDITDIVCYKSVAGGSDGVFTTRYVQTGSLNASASVYVDGAYNSTDFLTSGRILGFDMPMYGGFDGKDILQAEPFINESVLDTQTETNGAAYRAIKAAIDIVSSPELVDMNVLCVPGLKKEALTSYMIDTCKTRGDSIAIIDLKGDYKYPYETGGAAVLPENTNDVIDNLTNRAIDNSYGCAYFPAVFVASEGIFLPASIAALGAFGGTEGRSALWFAPAGFNRGGLTEGNAGIGVSRTALQLNATDRDALYEVNINPIATFPNEGVLIFGQKTLQQTPSALDRVNVRRLLNYIKKQVSRAATRVLFEPNVEATWNNFKGVVEPFLQGIKNAYGLDDARVVLDSSTTTADLIDRNIMYCKIFIKPTRAIEYIAIDFVVTNSGAAFTE